MPETNAASATMVEEMPSYVRGTSNYVGAIDQGTTSTRFIVFDRTGRVVSVAQKEHEQIYPRPGWVEHDPEEIWQKHARSYRRSDGSSARCRPTDLAAIGITNQRETTVVWNRKTGQAVCNAIVWQDMRVADAVAEFSRDGGQDRFRQEDRPASLDVLQRAENSLDPRKRAGRAGASRIGRNRSSEISTPSRLASHRRGRTAASTSPM